MKVKTNKHFNLCLSKKEYNQRFAPGVTLLYGHFPIQ